MKFDDPESTWYHINVANGEILNRITSGNRLERWIFKGLHSLDFQFLVKHDSLKDAALSIEPTTGETHRRHHVSADGFYRGKEVLSDKS